MTESLLFVYGTLCDPDVLAAVLGRVLADHQSTPATALGFRVACYPGRVYPALLVCPGGTVPGRLLFGLTPLDLDVLDAFEGGEYWRGTITVTMASERLPAACYLPTASIAPDAPAWTLATWTQIHKARFLAAERQAMRERPGTQ